MASTEDIGHRYLGLLLDGRYRLTEEVGRGGMGAVFRALDERLKRQVAVKVIQAGDLAGEELARHRQRFIREAHLAARISHPNVVTIHDFGTYVTPETGKEVDYIVMDLLRGENLAEWLPRLSRTDFSLPFSLLYQTALGLAAGHREGVVHRDVKPRNVLVVPGAKPGELWARVVDFGIAKPVHDDGAFGEITVGPGFVGTASYASPEQLRGGTVPGPASDVFSLGLVGYELFTGTLPFTEGDRNRLSQGLFVPLRSPRLFNPALPPALEEVIVGALALDPDDRFADADAFASALEAAWKPAEAAPLPDATVEVPKRETERRAGGTLPGPQPLPEAVAVRKAPSAPAARPDPAIPPVRPRTPARPERPGDPVRRWGWWVAAAAVAAAAVATVARGTPDVGATISSLIGSGARATRDLTPGQAVAGEIGPRDRESETGPRFDAYRYRAHETGPVVVSLQASGFEATMQWGRMVDGALQVLESGSRTTNGWMTVSVEEGGEYLLRIQSQFSWESGTYTLTVRPGAPEIRAGDTLSSTLSAADDATSDGEYAEYWSYRGRPGEQVTAVLEPAAAARLEWGRMVGGVWSSYEAGGAEPRLTVTAADADEYLLRVRKRQPSTVQTPYVVRMSSGPLEIGPNRSLAGRLSSADHNLGGVAYETWKYLGVPRQAVTFTLEAGDSVNAHLEVGRFVGGQWQVIESSEAANGSRNAQLAVAADPATYFVRAGLNLQTGADGPYELSASTSLEWISVGQVRRSVLSSADLQNDMGLYFEDWNLRGTGERVRAAVVGSGRYALTLYRNGQIDTGNRPQRIPDGPSVYMDFDVLAGEQYRILVFKAGAEQDAYSLSVSRLSNPF